MSEWLSEDLVARREARKAAELSAEPTPSPAFEYGDGHNDSEEPTPARAADGASDELVDIAWGELTRICSGGKFQMTIPASPQRDSDLIFGAALSAQTKEIAALRSQVASLEREASEREERLRMTGVTLQAAIDAFRPWHDRASVAELEVERLTEERGTLARRSLEYQSQVVAVDAELSAQRAENAAKIQKLETDAMIALASREKDIAASRAENARLTEALYRTEESSAATYARATKAEAECEALRSRVPDATEDAEDAERWRQYMRNQANVFARREQIRIVDEQIAARAARGAPVGQDDASVAGHHENCASIRSASDVCEGITKPCNCQGRTVETTSSAQTTQFVVQMDPPPMETRAQRYRRFANGYAEMAEQQFEAGDFDLASRYAFWCDEWAESGLREQALENLQLGYSR